MLCTTTFSRMQAFGVRYAIIRLYSRMQIGNFLMHVSARKAGSSLYRPARGLRLALIGLLLLAVIALLALLLTRRAPGAVAPWLRIAPAVGLVDEATRLAVNSGGWRAREDMAICLAVDPDQPCDEQSAVQIETSDAEGNLEAALIAGPLLLEGRTVVLVRGLKSQHTVSQSFRTLRAVGNVPIVAVATATPDFATVATVPSSETAFLATAVLPGSAQGWRGEYFANPDLAGAPLLVRDDPDPNFDWGDGSPDPAVIPVDGFSARWTRRIAFAAGLHRFVLTATDGARLLLDGQPVLDAWNDQSGQQVSTEQSLDAREYDVTLEFHALQGAARLAFGWSAINAATPAEVAQQATAIPVFTAETQAAPAADTPTFTPVAITTATTAPATATVVPGSTSTPSATAVPGSTPTPSATANGSTLTPTATAVAGATTVTPTATVANASTAMPPGSVRRIVDINPVVITSTGQQVTVTSGNWSPGSVLKVSLAEYGKAYTQAVALPSVGFTTPLDSSQSWSFRFNFPNSEPWISQVYPVQVWIHTATWSEWAWDQFTLELP